MSGVKVRPGVAGNAGILPMPVNRSASNPTHHQLLKLQKKIHHSLEREVTRLLGEMPDAIRRYERDFREDFKRIPRRPTEVRKEDLIREIRGSDVTLIGDFHTFSQAQRTALRLLRECVRDEEAWYLGLEMFPSHKQEILDRFQLGQLSENRFLEEIGYQEDWGFPWQQYAPLIHWAIRHRVKLVALNRPKELARADEDDFEELLERDRWAAGLITDLFQSARTARVRKPRMIVLYGELHVARKHLPAAIKEISSKTLKTTLRSLILHQNYDSLYWKIAAQGRVHEAEIIRLRQRHYCVLSSPPWARLQSVINWAEGDTHPENPEQDEEIDPLSLMKKYADVVAEFFSLPKPSFDSLNVYTIRNADFIENLQSAELPSIEKRLIRYHVLHNHRIYAPNAALAYLAAPSENIVAEIASIHLLKSRLEGVTSTETKDDRSAAHFYLWILDHAFGFLGSLILNPRRKCDLAEDHKERLKELKKKRDKESPATYPHELEARELALALLETSDLEDPELLSQLQAAMKKANQVPALFFAARYVGSALAKLIHHSLLSGTIEMSEVRRIFVGDLDGALAPAFWRFSSLRSAAFKAQEAASKTETL